MFFLDFNLLNGIQPNASLPNAILPNVILLNTSPPYVILLHGDCCGILLTGVLASAILLHVILITVALF